MEAKSNERSNTTGGRRAEGGTGSGPISVSEGDPRGGSSEARRMWSEGESPTLMREEASPLPRAAGGGHLTPPTLRGTLAKGPDVAATVADVVVVAVDAETAAAAFAAAALEAGRGRRMGAWRCLAAGSEFWALGSDGGALEAEWAAVLASASLAALAAMASAAAACGVGMGE